MDLLVKRSRTGLGAFASESAKRGDVVVDWSDHPLFAQPPRIPPDWRFVQMSPGVLVGPVGPERHPDAYINHSCDPNSMILIERPRIELIALRDIGKDEEVTFDYATLYRHPWSMKCGCGSLSCRGIIHGH